MQKISIVPVYLLVISLGTSAAVAYGADAPEKPFADDPDYADNLDVPPPPSKSLKKGGTRPSDVVVDSEGRKKKDGDGDEDKENAKPSKSGKGHLFGGGHIGIAPSIGFGSGYVAAALSVTYYFNKWLGLDVSGFYRDSKDGNDVRMIDYGPEIDLKLMLPLTRIVTPYAGAGPGFQKWVIKKDDEIFDDSSAATGNAFVGLEIGLSSHFAIDIMSKTTSYVQDPPRVYPDRDKFRPRSENRTFIGFKLRI